MCKSEPMLFDVFVDITHREGISDPEGATIERALPALGFHGVAGVHVGKTIRFQLESADEAAAAAEVEQLCHKFLTNPVIEDSSFTITERAS
jgi:phosphoribosylformylglycinamidine synthase PurS subunit